MPIREKALASGTGYLRLSLSLDKSPSSNLRLCVFQMGLYILQGSAEMQDIMYVWGLVDYSGLG